MKKLFTMFAVYAATFAVNTATAGTTVTGTLVKAPNAASLQVKANSSLRSLSCDTLFNLNFATADSTPYYESIPAAYGEGYIDGNGSLNFGTGYLPVTGVGEEFTAPSSTGQYVTASFIVFTIIDINPGDSNMLVTAYVYDTAATGAFNQVSPGNAIDSATTTLRAITQTHGVGLFSFTHQAILSSEHFFIGLALPQTTGDTLVIPVNGDTTGNGHGFVNVPGNGGWASYDSLTGTVQGNWIYASVCSNSTCPTITVTASELGNTTSASASASGGASPYTFAWSGGQASTTTDTVTGLTNNNTYTVTATDHNGCTGTATVSIATGIAQINAGIANFSVYPNPSNGSFTANISLVQASDVTISIVDMTGSKLYESTETNVQNLNKQINLGTVAAGIYFINVKTPQGTINQRIAVN